VRNVTAPEIPAMARTLALAFVDDPVMSLLFNGSVPVPRATRFFEIMGRVQLHHGHTYITDGDEAAAIWAPPGQWKLPVKDIVMNTPAFLRVMGLRFPSSLKILNALEKNHPHEPHYYLEFIGTDPAQQGNGFGSELMRPVIERCDTEGVGAYLESSKESNLAFYGRYGFETTKIIHHKNPDGEPVPQWLMWRNPR
jgi:GNAT superfamily N-acetyltransferase